MLHLDATLTSNCDIGWSWKPNVSGSSADMPVPVQGDYGLNLIPSDEPTAPKSAAAISISRPAKAAPVATASDETAASEIYLGRFRSLTAQIAQYCVDALMIALDCCAWPMELQDAR
jgi:hypothetical protein